MLKSRQALTLLMELCPLLPFPREVHSLILKYYFDSKEIMFIEYDTENDVHLGVSLNTYCTHMCESKIMSFYLPAGDWDVVGRLVAYNSVDYDIPILVGLSLGHPRTTSLGFMGHSSSSVIRRFSCCDDTTVYLVGQSLEKETCVSGSISARRIR